VGLLLAFFGTLLFLYPAVNAGYHGATTWNSILSNIGALDPFVVKIAFVFIIIGYGTKAGLVPMHTWLPDAHSKAPAPISALLSGVLLNVALVNVLRFKAITDAAVGKIFTDNLFLIFGLLSVFIAALIILTQRNYKRMLAYSSIENMGVAVLGFGAGPLGVFAATLHLIYHALLKSALFLSAGTIFLKYSSTKIGKVRGMLTALPITGVLFLAGFFAITGAPPFGIFFIKITILAANMKNHPAVGVIAVILMSILFIGFFKQAAAMAFGEKPAEIESGKENVWLVIPPLTLILAVLYLSFFPPSFLQTLINDIVAHY
jgi:hydrogenase-4 component F